METKQDATQNCPLEFLRSTERNGDDGRVEDLGESSSLTDAMITKTLVNPDYEEEDDEDDRHRSEDDESNQNAIIVRPGSLHRYLYIWKLEDERKTEDEKLRKEICVNERISSC